jgi:hypothetical protein
MLDSSQCSDSSLLFSIREVTSVTMADVLPDLTDVSSEAQALMSACGGAMTIAVILQHSNWTYLLMCFGRWIGPLGGSIYIKTAASARRSFGNFRVAPIYAVVGTYKHV